MKFSGKTDVTHLPHLNLLRKKISSHFLTIKKHSKVGRGRRGNGEGKKKCCNLELSFFFSFSPGSLKIYNRNRFNQLPSNVLECFIELFSKN